jgi:hypothetical protein
MTAKDAILKIRALFEDMPQEDAPVETKVKMEEYVLLDGTKVNVSELSIGGVVTLEDGSFAPMGEHTLADGSVIQLDEAGVIIEIASPKEDLVPEEEMSKMIDKKVEEMSASFKSQIESLSNQNAELKSKLLALEQKSKEGFSSVINMFEDFSKMPSTDPIQKPTSFKFEKTNDLKFDRIEKYRNAILNNKN